MVLVHCNTINSQYNQDLRVLCTFVPNKSFSQLVNILSTNHIYSETYHSELSYNEVWFTDQNCGRLKMKGTMSLDLVINDNST